MLRRDLVPKALERATRSRPGRGRSAHPASDTDCKCATRRPELASVGPSRETIELVDKKEHIITAMPPWCEAAIAIREEREFQNCCLS
jgi:hypothetical protein